MDAREQERHYRRGLILGLTVAEVMLLVLFCLLLLFLHIFKTSKPLTPAQRTAVRLADEVIAADAGESSENDFKDLFESLTVLVRSGNAKSIKALTDTVVQFRSVDEPRDGGATDDRDRADRTKESPRERLAAVKALAEAVIKSGDGKTIEQAAQIATEISAAKASLGDKSPVELMREVIDHERQARADGVKAVKPGGAGTEHPSCWTSPETGKPEYIFDATLTSGFIAVHDNALPHRAREQGLLPVQGISFDQDVNPTNFMAMTLPLYSWSDAHDCRFFVRIVDKTEGHEKAIYKRELRVVGERFYHFEDLIFGNPR